MNYSKIFIGLALLAVAAISCEPNFDNDEISFTGIADIYARCIKSGEDTLYAPVVYVNSNMYLAKANAFEPNAGQPTYQLTEYFNGKQAFRSVPDSLDFSPVDVVNGVYDFDLISINGDSIRVRDKLLESRIDPVEISKFTYEKDNRSFELEWNYIEDADVYVVKIMDEINGKYVYVSKRIYKNSCDFNQLSLGWIEDFEKETGATYVLGVFAYEFEDKNATDGYDINCESVEFREFEW